MHHVITNHITKDDLCEEKYLGSEPAEEKSRTAIQKTVNDYNEPREHDFICDWNIRG